MSIEVKQLVINSSIDQQKNEGSSCTGSNKGTEDNKKAKKNNNSGEADSFNVDTVKSDILNECRRMIKRSLDEWGGR